MSALTYPLRVLVVDDDEGIAALLEAAFAADGRFLLVGRASDGGQGVALARELAPDVVLMDLHMPGMGGVEATRAIVANDADACVVAFTSSSEPADHEAIRLAGATAVLAKPFDPSALLDAVEAHAERCSGRAA